MTRDEAVTKLWTTGAIPDTQAAKYLVDGLAALGLLEVDKPKTQHQIIVDALKKRFGPDLAHSMAAEFLSSGLSLAGVQSDAR